MASHIRKGSTFDVSLISGALFRVARQPHLVPRTLARPTFSADATKCFAVQVYPPSVERLTSAGGSSASSPAAASKGERLRPTQKSPRAIAIVFNVPFRSCLSASWCKSVGLESLVGPLRFFRLSHRAGYKRRSPKCFLRIVSLSSCLIRLSMSRGTCGLHARWDVYALPLLVTGLAPLIGQENGSNGLNSGRFFLSYRLGRPGDYGHQLGPGGVRSVWGGRSRGR